MFQTFFFTFAKKHIQEQVRKQDMSSGVQINTHMPVQPKLLISQLYHEA